MAEHKQKCTGHSIVDMWKTVECKSPGNTEWYVCVCVCVCMCVCVCVCVCVCKTPAERQTQYLRLAATSCFHSGLIFFSFNKESWVENFV